MGSQISKSKELGKDTGNIYCPEPIECLFVRKNGYKGIQYADSSMDKQVIDESEYRQSVEYPRGCL